MDDQTTRFGQVLAGLAWDQTVHSVTICVSLPAEMVGKVRGRDLDVTMKPEHVRVMARQSGAGDAQPIFDAQLWQRIKVDESHWQLEHDHVALCLGKYVKRERGMGKGEGAGLRAWVEGCNTRKRCTSGCC